MPDDNRFAGLSEAVEEDDVSATAEVEHGTDPAPTEDDGGDGDGGAEPADAATSSTSDDDDDADPNRSGSETSDDESSDDESSDPTAFPFDATTKKTVYVRQQTLDSLEDAHALVDAQLRTQHDVRDLTGREFYDAAFRLAAEDTDALVEEVLAEREE